MISSSPTTQHYGESSVASSSSTKSSASGSRSGSTNGSPSMGMASALSGRPISEMLASGTGRSAFLQSLQKSRERDEYERERDRERERERDRERERGHFESELQRERARHYEHQEQRHHSRRSDILPNEVQHHQPPVSSLASSLAYSPMSRRRLTVSSTVPAGSTGVTGVSNASISTSPVRPLSQSTPSQQSKLAAHTYTLSRSTDEEDSLGAAASGFPSSASKLFPETPMMSGGMRAPESAIRAPHPSEIDIRPPRASSNVSSSTEKAIADSFATLTATLRNDLQNLHVEMIKQSLAQQSALKSLFETYLPLTGRLMDTLAELREENERLKFRLEDHQRRSK